MPLPFSRRASQTAPSFSRDFAGLKTLDHGVGPAITFTRGTNATYFDATGTLRFAPNNHIRNSQATGATVGVIGSGGVMPNLWSITSGGGLTRQVIGTGTEDGFRYIDIRISGTASDGGSLYLTMETGAAASSGQTWSLSSYAKLVSGSLNGVALLLALQENDSGQNFLARTTATVVPTSGAIVAQRTAITRTLNNASTANANASYELDYVNGAAIDLTLRIAAPQLELGSTATDYNPTTGTAYFGPRFDHSGGSSLGLLIEEARTNSIRNSQAGGSTNGVIGSGGVMPTNWFVGAGLTSNGISTEVIGTGASSGLNYIDIKVSGTPTTSSAGTIRAEAANTATAANGQTWTSSAYVRLINGALTNATVRIGLIGNDGSADVGGQSGATAITPTSASIVGQRSAATFTFTSASVTRCGPFIQIEYTSGQAIDLTLRIAAPQLEQGAFPTSYIPTTTAAATRSADSAVVTPISSFYNASEGTIYNEFSVPRLDGSGTLRGVAQFTETAGVQNRLQTGVRGNGVYNFGIVASNVGEVTIETGTGAVTEQATAKAAVAYQSGNSARSINGLGATLNTSAITQPSRTRLIFGDVSATGAAVLNGHIRKIAYWPRRLSNALLQQLTT